MLLLVHVGLAVYVITRCQRFTLGILVGVFTLLASVVALFFGATFGAAAGPFVLLLATVATYKAFAETDMHPPDTTEHRESNGTAMALLALTLFEALLLTVRVFILYVAHS